MSGTPTNVARDTTPADYMNWLRIYAQSQQNAGSAGSNFTPQYILEFSDIIDITDTAALGPSEAVSDGIKISDSFAVTNYPNTVGSAVVGFSVVG